MLIKVIDADELERRHACWGYIGSDAVSYQVLAVRSHRGRRQYLVEDDMRLTWWDADLFEVTESTIPREWVEVQYGRFHKLKNEKYDFKIPLNYYRGPKEFLDNEDFFFDIHENPGTALESYKTL